MRIPFVGPSAQARSLNQDAERTINLFLEKNPSPGREWALYAMPGTVLRATFPTSPNRGCIKMGSLTYWVAGNTVYKMDAAFTVTALGTIGTSTGRVGMAANGTEVLIVDGVAGWLATSGTLTQIADPDFPNGVTVALYLDSYFIVLGDGTQKLYWNETPGSGSAWNGLDFASAEGNPDLLVGGVVEGRNLWLFGTESIELWRDTGDVAQPFQRMDGVFIEQGTVSGWTAAKMDNSVFWLGQGEHGDGIVFRSNGSAPQRVSSHAVETAMQGYASISDAFAWVLQFAGHSFYVLSFPTADATWFYDAATEQWSEWLWRDPADNTLHRHRAGCHVFAGRKHLIGDWDTGKVYSLEADTYTDNGDPIVCLRRTQTVSAGGNLLFFGELIVDIETGVGDLDTPDPQLMMRYSDDGGHSWSDEDTYSLGGPGEYDLQVKFGPSGCGRNRVWEVSRTDPVKVALFGADVAITKGD